MCTLADFTPQELLAIMVGPTSFGRIGPKEVQADIDNNGTYSQRAKAKSDIERLAAACGLTIADIDAGSAQCQNLNLGLRWYTIYRYKDLDIKTRKKGDCGEDDYRMKENAFKAACEALRAVGDKGVCMASKLKEEITGDTCGEWDGLYGSKLITDSGCSS